MDFTSIVIIIVLLMTLMLAYIAFSLRKRGFSTTFQKKIQTSWKHIKSFEDHHRAILEADKLLDIALKEKGYQGTVGQKLKNSGALFSDLNAVWYAHKLRNTVAHELHYNLTQKEYDKAMMGFYKGLRDLGCDL